MNQHVLFRDAQTTADAVSESPQKRLRRIAALAGCHHAILHRLASTDAPLKSLSLIHNWRDAALLALRASDFMPPDVHVRLSSGEPMVSWSGEALCERTRRTLARAQINAFIAVPFHNAHGAHLSLTLCDTSLALPASRMGSLRLAATDFASAEWRRSTCNLAGAPTVSTREADCLQWAAAGKTSEECALILSLSPHTVNQHLASAAAKLGAVNRVQAVAKAVRAGLVNLAGI
jgi:DNA-binding CsgD family transcriptional regulator